MNDQRNAKDEAVSVIARRFCVCEWEGFCSVCLDRAYAEALEAHRDPKGEEGE